MSMQTLLSNAMCVYRNATCGLYNDCVIFKVLQRRILMQVERAPGEKNLLDRNSCGYKVDPLTSVLTLEKHLHTMVRLYTVNA